ncbi:hormogonium polysaccharide biosynthesis glycosyltransferase HpsE [Nostoc sp. FACHB-280]|uniref:hormogonium polysaccharide biosynthesis glycosyltransferase HpsE n=1 Tax=Nostoc sp. FACHB-280 TaxID=2692839 RepID=UPI00168BEC63|nr:hormogonium polysaccharide biosynthesis glycosyltransferase HpsE [Nostoc sp. FACHB-280]MBD2497627.1 glycosyltransferase family 2 protein [Nostoc sp. FACHB-280]
MSIDFTVAIPTYNGENRLPQVLERLQNQIGVENISWEIIIVDNNSTDNTAKLIQKYQQNWQQAFPLKYIFEPKQGAAFARNKAVFEAQSELIGFLDDDNLPAPNWIISAYQFAKTHPQAGAYASQIHGCFEIPPPENLKAILFYLAITERGETPHQYHPRRQGFPPTAGLVVRKNAWKDNVPHQLFLVGRVGSSMLGSEDAESLFYIQKAGWEIWYNPAMELEHIIPAWRLEKVYLLSLMRGIGLARYYLRMLLLETWQKPFAFFAYLFNDTRKVILHFILHRQVLSTDIVAACEMERLISTLISPVYIWKLKMQKAMANFNNQIKTSQ